MFLQCLLPSQGLQNLLCPLRKEGRKELFFIRLLLRSWWFSPTYTAYLADLLEWPPALCAPLITSPPTVPSVQPASVFCPAPVLQDSNRILQTGSSDKDHLICRPPDPVSKPLLLGMARSYSHPGSPYQLSTAGLFPSRLPCCHTVPEPISCSPSGIKSSSPSLLLREGLAVCRTYILLYFLSFWTTCSVHCPPGYRISLRQECTKTFHVFSLVIHPVPGTVSDMVESREHLNREEAERQRRVGGTLLLLHKHVHISLFHPVCSSPSIFFWSLESQWS